MTPLLRATLSLLRLATHTSLFLEAQRLLLRLLRPTRHEHLRRLEAHVLRDVRAPVSHHFVRDSGGNLVHVLEARPPSARSSGSDIDSDEDGSDAASSRSQHTRSKQPPTVVLLHGHSMSAAFWFRNIDDLVSQGFRVIAPDLLGWGRSGRPRFRGQTAEHSVDWYLQSLSTVLPRFTANRPVLLVGHSLGAYLAMEYTARFPARVRQLVLVSPAAAVRPVPFARAVYFSFPPQRIVRRGGLLGFLLFVAKYPREEMYMRDRLRDFTYHLANQYPPSGEAAVRPIIRFQSLRHAECDRPLIENLSTRPFAAPVQIICGEVDTSMPVEGVHALFHEMKRRNFDVRMNVVAGSNHCPQLEKPEEFSDILASFAKRTSFRSNFTGGSISHAPYET